MKCIVDSLIMTILGFSGAFFILFSFVINISIAFLFALGVIGAIIGYAAEGWEGAFKLSYIQFAYAFIGMFLCNFLGQVVNKLRGQGYD